MSLSVFGRDVARSRSSWRGSAVRALAAVSLVAFAACEGETLYDGEEITGPSTSLTPHTVAIEADLPERVELTDSVSATVRWRDEREAGNVVRVGVTALVLGQAGDTLDVIVTERSYGAPQRGSGVEVFEFRLSNVNGPTLPDSVTLELHGFAINANGACAAAVENVEQRLACRAVGGGQLGVDAVGARQEVVITAGRTFLLPSGGLIADALVSFSTAPRLYLSNLTNHTIDVLDLASTATGGTGLWESVEVGSEPWGLTMDLGNQNLLVANSGGTSISSVPTSTLVENINNRIHTPNTALWELTVATDTLGAVRYEGFFIDFSDRPQFIAQDFTGLFLYSTVPTEAAGSGTIRLAERLPGWEQPEVRILFTGRAVNSSPNHWALAHIDSLRVFIAPNQDFVNLYDHVPGFPDQFIESGPLPIEAAIPALADEGSDIFAQRGQWVISEVGLSDTTFVAASGDRRFVAFGEGARSPAGRIIMWDAADRVISNEVSVADLVSNSSEHIFGVGLNQNGSLGVARGTQGAYFFNNDLRLQGFSRNGLAGGGGATIRPNSVSANTLAFVGTGRNSIQILSTDHYLPRGEIVIRDNIVGPLKAAEPLPQDNAGQSCPGSPACVVVKLYGVTSGGGVVVVDVRERDIQ